MPELIESVITWWNERPAIMPSQTMATDNAPKKRRLALLCCATVITLACILLLIPAIHMTMWPNYPLAADIRRQAFQLLLEYIHTHSLADRPPIELKDIDKKWSWRVVIAGENCNVPRRELDAALGKSWKDSTNTPLGKCGQGIFGREDGSTFILCLKGAGSAYDQGLENTHTFPSSLILFMETADKSVAWMEPRDFLISDLNTSSGPKPGSEYGRGFHVAFADGSVWYLHQKTPMSVLSRFFTSTEATVSDRDALLGEYVITKTRPRWR